MAIIPKYHLQICIFSKIITKFCPLFYSETSNFGVGPMDYMVEKALMDYVLIEKRVKGRLQDVRVYRGAAVGVSDHYLVEARVVVAKEWCNSSKM